MQEMQRSLSVRNGAFAEMAFAGQLDAHRPHAWQESSVTGIAEKSDRSLYGRLPGRESTSVCGARRTSEICAAKDFNSSISDGSGRPAVGRYRENAQILFRECDGGNIRLRVCEIYLQSFQSKSLCQSVRDFGGSACRTECDFV